MRYRFLKQYLVLILLILLGISPYASSQGFDKVQIETVKVTDKIYMLVGAGGNIGVSIGEDGVLLIDTQFPQLFEKITAAVARLDGDPIRFVLNTNWHYDHVDGNELLTKSGAVVLAHANSRKHMMSEWAVPELEPDRKILPYSKEALPVITVDDFFTLHFNGEDIQAIHIPNAHSDGDLIYYFPKENVIHSGDIYFSGGFPFINITSGGTIDGMIAAADKIIGMCDADTKVIPGHGPLSNRTELQTYRKMIATARDRIAKLIEEGKTLDDVLSAKPVEGLYKGGTSSFPDEIFVKVVYWDLTNHKFE